MAEEMPVPLLMEWMAYAQLEPWGEERMDLRFGDGMALYANSNRDPKKKGQPFRAQDFLRKWGEDERDVEERSRKKAVGEAKAAAARRAIAAVEKERDARMKAEQAEKKRKRQSKAEKE